MGNVRLCRRLMPIFPMMGENDILGGHAFGPFA